MEALHLLIQGFLVVVVLMAVLWGIGMAMENAAIVDVGWSVGLPIITLFYAWRLEACEWRHLALIAMVLIWGGRLGTFLFFTRIYRQPEEGRYVELRREWKSNIEWKFFLFFEAQALLVAVLSLPFLMALSNPSPAMNAVELLGVVLWGIGVIGESVADMQLQRYKMDPAHKGTVCEDGLWNYSRHPNYFFETVVWIGYATFASASPYGWLGWIGPALILFLLFRVTGIPATEAQALRSKGELYRRYQETTSMFIPWWKKA